MFGREKAALWHELRDLEGRVGSLEATRDTSAGADAEAAREAKRRRDRFWRLVPVVLSCAAFLLYLVNDLFTGLHLWS